MVTHRGTAQNDDTVQVAAEPAGGPRSETTLVLLRNGPFLKGSAPVCAKQFPIMDSTKQRGSLTLAFSGERSESAARRC